MPDPRAGSAGPGGAWSAPAHLTLRFLGEITPERAREVCDALAPITAGCGEFRLTLEGIGGFPDLQKPRIVYAEVAEGRSEVVALAREIDAGLARIGLDREGRPFVPHVTVLRVRSARDIERIRQIVDRGKAGMIGEIWVRELYLKSSTLSAGGARHEIVGRWPLAPRPSPVTVGPDDGPPPSEGNEPFRHD